MLGVGKSRNWQTLTNQVWKCKKGWKQQMANMSLVFVFVSMRNGGWNELGQTKFEHVHVVSVCNIVVIVFIWLCVEGVCVCRWCAGRSQIQNSADKDLLLAKVNLWSFLLIFSGSPWRNMLGCQHFLVLVSNKTLHNEDGTHNTPCIGWRQLYEDPCWREVRFTWSSGKNHPNTVLLITLSSWH